MILQLKPLFAGEIERLNIDAQLDLSTFSFQGTCPLQAPVSVKGAIVERADMLWLNATVTYVFEGVCDRCLSPVRRELTTEMEHILVSSLNGEETDELILVENDELELESLVEADIYLDLPQKILCRSDCRGLCQHCGKNLNDGLCGCQEKKVDPRLAALASLLTDDTE